ncbi:hypothetical protein H4R99_004357 [Coemansia sp. RSA 1722]|nr:hypothetical protein LPJ57_002354 [Coemansia sp. RSA 486]KAJ2233713.1 hypothetical protein IWW45_003968 [Coemansia sp. RSA 485]KAJ2597804.1 hypothetical protein H4R99_004357 [Coemansia sp. RSA 1722]KAJ2598566.1 hypothetical protein GGF39_002603 [Coemansia sp. RSA 1721]
MSEHIFANEYPFLSRLDDLVHAVFDPLHLQGVGYYWRPMLFSWLLHVALIKLIPQTTKHLLPSVYARMSKDDKRLWKTSLVGLVHTVYDSWFVIKHFHDVALNGDRMGGFNREFEFYLALAMGYYVWDLTVCILNFRSYGPMYLIHAALGVFGILVMTSRHLQFYAIPFLLPEVSSVLLNIRHLLKVSGLSNTLVYKINFLIFVVAFIAIRIGFEMYHSAILVYQVYQGNTGNAFYPFAVYFAALGVTLTTLNFIWLKQILVAASYTLGTPKKREVKNE